MNDAEKAMDAAAWRLHRLQLACESRHPAALIVSRDASGRWQPSRCRQCEEFGWAQSVFQHWTAAYIKQDDLVAARNILTAGEARLGSVL